MRRVLLCLALVMVTALSVPAAANIAQNWSFENPETTLWQIAPPGDPLGRLVWTVGSGNPSVPVSVYLVNTATNGYYVTTAYDGSQVVQLTEYSWLSQVLPTVAGQRYKVTFAFTGAVNVPEAEHKMLVVWQSVLGTEYSNAYAQDYVFAAGQGNTPANPMWSKYEFEVTAGAGVNTINFGGVTMYPWVDAVTVEAIPEPGSLLTLLTGLVGIAAWRRKR